MDSVQAVEQSYLKLISLGARPEEARELLPNSLKTEIVATADIREWRHILQLRCSKHAHPQMRALMRDCCLEFQEKFPILFDDIIFDNESKI